MKNKNTTNPFNITRAVDLNDKEIEELWVNITKNTNSFNDVIKPTSSMPMLILGAKGSGKTHLMRYCSYQIQKIRNKTINDILSEGYIGIYYRCTGLNSNRFSGKGLDPDTWNSVFAYYFEIWLVEQLLKVCKEIIVNFKKDQLNETLFAKEITKLFDVKITKKNNIDLDELISLLNKLQKQIDFAVNESALTKKLRGFRIAATPGKLIFGIPEILRNYIDGFKNIKFLYLIDEFENLTSNQQKYINTLIREQEQPTSFKIGSRLYGVKTYKTFSDEEENKEGSEFEKFVIDDYFREYSDYSNFIRMICINRLQQHGYSSEIKVFDPLILKNLNNFFEKEDKQEYYNELVNKFTEKGLLPPYLEKLKKKLLKFGEPNSLKIIQNLRVPNNPLVERTNIFLFYRAWKNPKGIDLHSHSSILKKEASQFLKGSLSSNKLKIVLDKFKTDIEDQLILECNGKLQYGGLENFIKMSSGIPRVFLKILKHVFQSSLFNGDMPFNGGVISIYSQSKGVHKAADWFFDDARLKGTEGKRIKNSISRLARFLREIRFSDLPPECSLCSFTLDMSTISEETSKIIEMAEQCSYLIKASERRDKSTKNIKITYQVNGILAPKWDLPLAKRGDLSISNLEAEAIFLSKEEIQFEYVLKKRLKYYNYPFSQTKSDFENQSLFN